MMDLTTFGDSKRTFITDAYDHNCDTCENNGKGADKCRFLENGICNYVPIIRPVSNTIKCHECIYATRKDDLKSNVSTYECSIGKFFADCNAFVAKDRRIPLPTVETEKPSEVKHMIHKIKIMESFADAVYFGDKTFEVRQNDRGYQKGDLVQFTVLHNSDKCEMISHPLMEQTYEITYVLAGWGIEDGYVVFGIRKVAG